MRKVFFMVFFLLLLSPVFAFYESSIKLFLEEDIIKQGGLLSFQVELSRISGPAGDVNLEYWVESENGEKWGYGNTTIFLEESPKTKNITEDIYIFASQPADTYFLKVVADFGNFYPVLSQSKQFLVLNRETTEKGAIIQITDYPEEINAESGWSKLYTIKVKNRGGEIIPNMSLRLMGIPETWYTLSPKTYYKV